MGVASLFMPGLLGIVADRWVNAERLYGILHLTGAALLVWASTVRDYETLYVIMLLNAMVYMPTIALNNTISYRVLEQQGMNFIQKFPPIRVWGTVGFVVAMWYDGPLRRRADDRAALHQRGRRGVPRAVRFHPADVSAVPRPRRKSVVEALGLTRLCCSGVRRWSSSSSAR